MSRRFLKEKDLVVILAEDSDTDDIPVFSANFEESDDDISDAESEHSDHKTDSDEQIS